MRGIAEYIIIIILQRSTATAATRQLLVASLTPHVMAMYVHSIEAKQARCCAQYSRLQRNETLHTCEIED